MHVLVSGTDQLVLKQLDGDSSFPLSHATHEYSNPAIAAGTPEIVLLRQRRITIASDGFRGFEPGDISFRPATLEGFAATPTRLFEGVSTSRDESQPAITADGCYIAFVRDIEGAYDHLFVWDSQTRTLLNPNGVDLGLQRTATRCGSTSLYSRPVIKSALITGSGRVNAMLASAASIDIFVQRIVGKTEVLGSKTWQLEPVGRVPLGS